MWLKRSIIEKILVANGLTRKQLAKELECGESHLNAVIDGKAEADESLSRLLIAAFGAEVMVRAIDWRRSAA